MRNLLFIILFFSSPENFKKFWKSQDGILFAQHLRKKEIGYQVYVEPHIYPEVLGPPSSDRVQPATTESLKGYVNHDLQRYQAVFLISDTLEGIPPLGLKGCLPFLLQEEKSPLCETRRYIEVDALSSLNPYFAQDLPLPLLTILSGRPVDYQQAINSRNERTAQQIHRNGGAYIFGGMMIGKQVYAECLKFGIKALGFIDNDPRKQGKRLCGLPIVPVSSLDPKTDVVILASGNYSYDIYQQLQSLGFQYIQNLSEFYLSVNSLSQPEAYYHEDLWNRSIHYHTLFLRLADNISRVVLENIVEYRKTFDLRCLSRICDKANLQWFSREFFIPSAEHVFVDGGAFDGDTALRFIGVNGNSYGAIHLFEIDPVIAQKARKKVEGYERVHVHNLGLSNKGQTGLFSRTGLTDGHLVAKKGFPVEIDSLDHVVEDRITFLKLDVEGAEESAITGATGHLGYDSPLLAVAAYHRAQDIWSLPLQIGGINPGYSFYLRHYTQVAYETVLYGLPNS